MLVLALLLASAATALSPLDLQACVGQRPFAADLKALGELRAGAPEAAWRAACAQAVAANDRRTRIVDQVLGGAVIEGYESAAKFTRQAASASDPVVRELFQRAARDQAARGSLSADARSAYGGDGSPTALRLLNGLISGEAVNVDQDNQAWLAETTKRRGWFVISRDGPDADAAAWLIVQHSDADPAFQKRMIDLLEPLAARGETSAKRFAYLYDRWAAGAGAPQRYGLQGSCVSPGQWRPRPLEAPGQVDMLRSRAGLPPLEEHVRRSSERCS